MIDKNAKNSTRARQGLACVTTAVLKDEAELLKQFMGNESFPNRGYPIRSLGLGRAPTRK
jgi:hypothetical protein